MAGEPFTIIERIKLSSGRAILRTPFFTSRSGKIKLTVVSERGKEAVVGILEPVDFFGEGCLNGHPLRVTTATAIDAMRDYTNPQRQK